MISDKSYLLLDEEDFRCLVRGGTVHCGQIKIALRDIGFHRMYTAIESAEDKVDIGRDHLHMRDG